MGINFDDGNADDSNFFEEKGAENEEREINGEQNVVHVVVKTDVKPCYKHRKHRRRFTAECEHSGTLSIGSKLSNVERGISEDDPKAGSKDFSSQGSGQSAASAVPISGASTACNRHQHRRRRQASSRDTAAQRNALLSSYSRAKREKVFRLR